MAATVPTAVRAPRPERFTRRMVERGEGPVPLGLSFRRNPEEPKHAVTVVAWAGPVLQALRDLNRYFSTLKHRQSVPIESLRARLNLLDPDNLRLDRSLGLWGPVPILLWTACSVAEASDRVRNAMTGWLANDVSVGDDTGRELVERLRQLGGGTGLVDARRRSAPVFAWDETRSGTTSLPDSNRHGYADLADFVARRLEGQELFPDLPGLRRVAGGELDTNEVELMTEPIPDQITSFSLVVKIRVLSFPGRGTPVVTLDVSRRIWTRVLKRAATKRLSAFALPGGWKTALRFTLRRASEASGGKRVYTYQPGEDYAPIARAFGLPLEMTGTDIAARGHMLSGCRLLVGHKHGVGERVQTRQGVPDLDKMAAFRRAAEVLAPLGFVPWAGVEETPTATRAQQHRNQKWRDRGADDEHRQAFAEWQEQTRADIKACYDGPHHIVIGYYKSCHGDAVRAEGILRGLLPGDVRVKVIPIPPAAHGPRWLLPDDAAPAPARAERRAREWKSLVEAIRTYQSDVGRSVDGILVIAPQWYDGSSMSDDPVNKRAAKIALARELRVPVQYLRPEQEDGQTFRRNQDSTELFETRLMVAWLDLAWKTVGMVKANVLASVMDDIYGAGAAALPSCEGCEGVIGTVRPPDRVLAIGVLRRNRTRLDNEPSFVPFAIELDLAKGTSSARFVRDRGAAFEITPLRALPEALAELASSGPIALASDKTDRRNKVEQLRERSEHFFRQVITEFCQRSERPVVLIDSVACRGVWTWASDAKLDPTNIAFTGHPHAEVDWGDVSIVRVRTGNAPKVLFDRYFEGVCEETGETLRYDAPRWADHQLFKLTDSKSNVYLSFGSLLRTGRILGSSCYRPVEGLKKAGAGPASFERRIMEPFTAAWSTPSAVELTVVRTAKGETPDQLVQVIEWLRTLYAHIGDWTTKPAPLFFENALREYIADYDLDEEHAEADEDTEEAEAR